MRLLSNISTLFSFYHEWAFNWGMIQRLRLKLRFIQSNATAGPAAFAFAIEQLIFQ